MSIQHQAFSPDLLTLIGAAETSIQLVAPLFPLHRAVAVNPFHGFRDEPIEVAAARLERAAGLRIFPARFSYRPKIDRNEIVTSDIMTARLEIAPDRTLTDRDILAAIDHDPEPVRAIPTVAEIAAEATGTDWPGLVLERIGACAQGHFDEGQALWSQDRNGGAWGAWREWAMRDLTPEILGLGGFTAMIMKTRQTPWRCKNIGRPMAKREAVGVSRWRSSA